MKIVPAICWTLEAESTEALDPRLVPLLSAVAETQSLAAAIARCGISYRAGWGLLRDYRRMLGTPLVLLERGRGARLTDAGTRLLGADRAASRRLSRILQKFSVEIVSKERPAKNAAHVGLRIAASHDLALAALPAELASDVALDLDLSFMGSLTALAEFAGGRADMAGFHVPLGHDPDWDRTPFLQILESRRDRLIRFVDRDQGLILPRGNPARVKSLADVASAGLRFVNRQRGSGTRFLIDRMIADAGLEPTSLDGYGTEEFTHPAVAATVASGGADAGFGLRAAASQYGLAFVPLVEERYYLAVRSKDATSAGVSRLLRVIRGAAFARLARRLPGYKATAAGTVIAVDALATARPAP